MGDPQWRVTQTQSGADTMSVDLDQGNLVCGYFRNQRIGNQSGALSVVAAETDAAIELDDGKVSCEADASGVALACYPPQSRAIVIETISSLGQYDFPLTVEEREQAMCLVGSPEPATFTAPPPKENNPVAEREPDATLLILQADENADDASNSSFQTSAENLGKFIIKQRTNVPPALQDMRSVAAQLREFGFESFRVVTAKTKQFPNGRKYLVFNGNPRKVGRFIGRRELIRSFGRYTQQNPNVMQMGIGTKSALKAGARATVVSFIVVAALDVVVELMEEDPSLAALGVTIAVDAGKLAASALAGALAAGAIAGGPVILVAGAGLVVGLAVGLTLDKIDETFGITDYLRKQAKEMEQELESSYSNFLYQLEWCIMHPHACFGG